MARARELAAAFAPPIGVALAIFILSGQSELPSVDVAGIDKLAHLVAFGLLSLLLSRGLDRTGVAPWTGAILAVLLTTLYGGGDEVHQTFTPGRSPDWWDLVADALGAVLGAAGWRAWRKR